MELYSNNYKNSPNQSNWKCSCNPVRTGRVVMLIHCKLIYVLSVICPYQLVEGMNEFTKTQRTVHYYTICCSSITK